MTNEEAARILEPETTASELRKYGDGNAQLEAFFVRRKRMDDKTLAMLGDHAAQMRLTRKEKVLPCPFCGSTEISTYVSSERDEYDWMTSHSYVYPYCEKCGASGPKVPLIGRGSPRDTWNTRAPILTPEQIKRLEEMG